MSNVKPKREWKIAVGAVLRTRESCIAVVGEGTAHHSIDGKPHNCWIGIDYSTGTEYKVFIARARPYQDQDGDWHMVRATDGRTASTVVAIPSGDQNRLYNCNIVHEITLPL